MEANRKTPALPIILVDDEEHTLFSFKLTLSRSGLNNLVTMSDGNELLPYLENQPAELILLDAMMPNCDGREILPKIKAKYPETPVIMVTALQDVENVVGAMRKGAYDYIVKPVNKDRLIQTVQNALRERQKDRELRALNSVTSEDLKEVPDAFKGIITNDREMFRIFKYCEALAVSGHEVLVQGESGTGKERMARGIHNLSGLTGNFVSCNVAGLDDHFFSDTLFGHKKGAFTGAHSDRPGLIEQANGGTLFLDEIGDLSMPSQMKLLRLLQEKEYQPLGSDQLKKANIRIVAATHKNLPKAIKNKEFRQDLYYRLTTHTFELPPLRERMNDLPLLVEHFVHSAAQQMNSKMPRVADSALALLKNYNFPGNIRELEALINDAVAKAQGNLISGSMLTERVNFHSDQPIDATVNEETNLCFTESMRQWKNLPTSKQMTNFLVDEALRRTENNITLAAHMLGITKQALSQRLKTRQRED